MMKISAVSVLLLTVAVGCCVANKTRPAMEEEKLEKLGKIVITDKYVPDVAREKLSRHFDVVFPSESYPAEKKEILELVKGATGILWSKGYMKVILDAEILDAAGPQLKAISSMSAGLDGMDIPEIKRRGIPLGHTPGVLNDAVADMAIGLMIAAGRRFHEASQKIRRGEWHYNPTWMLGKDIRGSTVGIVGLGGIGQTIAKRLQGFDIGQLVYTGRSRKPEEVEKKFRAEYRTFTDLIKTSDFVIISAPLTDETRNMFNMTVFQQMKSSAVLVNVGRGQIVNPDDLYKALRDKMIFSAGLDVTHPEPLAVDDPLLTLDNIVITPHLASATERARYDMAEIAALNILAGIAGERLLAPVP